MECCRRCKVSAHTANNFDKALELLHRPARSRLQSRYNRHLRRAWDVRMRTPFSASQAAGKFPQIATRYLALAAALIKREKELETALDRMAQEEVVRTSGCVYTLYASTGTWVYSSQGFGAPAYAANAAQMHADKLLFYGIPSHIQKIPRGRDQWGIEQGDFWVWAQADGRTCEVIRRKSSLPLREWVKSCWKRGVNPRVYQPFLPTGYEESVGLDYFGNDRPPAEPAPVADPTHEIRQ